MSLDDKNAEPVIEIRHLTETYGGKRVRRR